MGKQANKLTHAIMDLVRLHRGCWVDLNPNYALYDTKRGRWRKNAKATPGRPDLSGWVKGGRALLIEVKAPGDRLRGDQKAYLERAEKDGCLTIIAKSIDDVTRRFKDEGITYGV